MSRWSSATVASLVFLSFFTGVSLVSAHVVVKPASVNVSEFTTFAIGVPVEREQSTVGIRLVVPEGLVYVTPNVKQGWVVTTKKEGEGEASHVVEISWANGEIPQGQRDEFVFSAKVPSTESELHWKAYQTYKDGSVVSWDLNPKDPQPKDSTGKSDFSKNGPYSITKVVNDLVKPKEESQKKVPIPWGNAVSIIALVLSTVALVNSRRIQK